MGTGVWSVGDEPTVARMNELFQSDFWGTDYGANVCFEVGNRGAFIRVLISTAKTTGACSDGRMGHFIYRCPTSTPAATVTEYVHDDWIYDTDSAATSSFRVSKFYYVPYNSVNPWCYLYTYDLTSNMDAATEIFQFINL